MAMNQQEETVVSTMVITNALLDGAETVRRSELIAAFQVATKDDIINGLNAIGANVDKAMAQIEPLWDNGSTLIKDQSKECWKAIWHVFR